MILDFSLQNHETILFVISSYSVCGTLALRKQVHSLNECLQESYQIGTALISPIYRLSSPPISNLHAREGNRKLTRPSHGLGSEPGTDSVPSCPDFIPDISGTSSLPFSSRIQTTSAHRSLLSDLRASCSTRLPRGGRRDHYKVKQLKLLPGCSPAEGV